MARQVRAAFISRSRFLSKFSSVVPSGVPEHTQKKLRDRRLRRRNVESAQWTGLFAVASIVRLCMPRWSLGLQTDVRDRFSRLRISLCDNN
ncbi:hypothetical protein WA026_000929, partial [Henosepilachna vigintioctopunctata]